MPSFDQVIVWMVVGLIGGSLAGLACHVGKAGPWVEPKSGPRAGWRSCGRLFVSAARPVSRAGQRLRLIARYRGGRRRVLHRACRDLALAEVSSRRDHPCKLDLVVMATCRRGI